MEVSMPSASVLPAVGSTASTAVPTATAAPLPQLLPASASPRQSPKSLDNVPFRVYLRPVGSVKVSSRAHQES